MIDIDYVCFMNQTGYAQAALANILALEASDKYSVRLNCIHTMQKDAFSEHLYRRLHSLTLKTQKANATQIFHLIPDMQRRVDNRLKKTIGYGTFEAFKPPVRWISTLNQNDAVICPSEFNERIFRNQGTNRPICHVPHGIDLNIWHPEVEPMYQYSDFTFLFMGTWRKRKGWDLLLEAWAETFKPGDGVRLVIKTDKVDKAKNETDVKMSGFGKDYAPIFFESEIFSEGQMPSFVKSADCLISPTLGEGFGLPPVQAMSVGVPVIVTNFSGCCDYASESNCTLIEPSGFLHQDIMDNIPQFAGQKWPRLKVRAISEAMKSVVDDYKGTREKAANALQMVKDTYGYDSIVKNFDNMMESVYGVSVS